MIRWITKTLGTAAYGQLPPNTHAALVDVRDLVDKAGNAVTLVREKIDRTVELLRIGGEVVVCCDYGMSRSNAIAAGALSITENIDLSDAARRVIAATGERDIKVELLGVVRRALQAGEVRTAAARKRRLLMTGGGGFIGRKLRSVLEDTWTVFAPAQQDIDLTRDAVALDLYVQDHQIDTLFHLANPRIYTSNVAVGEMLAMMRNVLDVCRNNELKLFYLSGWEVFSAYRTQGLFADESLPVRATGPYGEAKLLAEVMLEQFHRNCGLRHCMVRSGPVFGRGAERPKFIYNFWEKAKAAENIYTHKYLNGFPALDIIAIEDLLTALKLLADDDAEGTFHVGGGEAVTTYEIARVLVALAGSKSEIGHREVDGYAANITMNTSKLRREFGWSPSSNIRDALSAVLLDTKKTAE